MVYTVIISLPTVASSQCGGPITDEFIVLGSGGRALARLFLEMRHRCYQLRERASHELLKLQGSRLFRQMRMPILKEGIAHVIVTKVIRATGSSVTCCFESVEGSIAASNTVFCGRAAPVVAAVDAKKPQVTLFGV